MYVSDECTWIFWQLLLVPERKLCWNEEQGANKKSKMKGNPGLPPRKTGTILAMACICGVTPRMCKQFLAKVEAELLLVVNTVGGLVDPVAAVEAEDVSF